jgi:hypothetical protein
MEFMPLLCFGVNHILQNSVTIEFNHLASISEDVLIKKKGVFLDVTPCGSCKNRRFGGTWRLLHQGDKNR